MTYSCSDFTDSILDALKIDVPEEHYDDPSKQADLALAEIERLQEAKLVAFDLWWFVENVTDTTPDRQERFFALRERIRALQS